MVQAFVLIQCNDLCVEQVIVDLKKVESVKEIQGLLGMYDVVIKVQAKDTVEMDKMISTQIRTIEKLRSTVTLIVSEE
ncbi:MAG: hypothetical protein MAG458_01767 [Nitrosopumilus sp.]|nr:hypothetical protein [Nitrosopumilus sp.]